MLNDPLECRLLSEYLQLKGTGNNQEKLASGNSRNPSFGSNLTNQPGLAFFSATSQFSILYAETDQIRSKSFPRQITCSRVVSKSKDSASCNAGLALVPPATSPLRNSQEVPWIGTTESKLCCGASDGSETPLPPNTPLQHTTHGYTLH